MNRKQAYEAEEILQRLENHDYISEDVNRLKEIIQPMIDNEKEKEFKEKRNVKTSYRNFNPHREVQYAVQALSKPISLYNEANQEIEVYQRETQDILHALELTDLDDEKMTELMQELRRIRIYRRMAKNFIEIVEPLYKFAMENRMLAKNLGRVAGEIHKIKENIDNRAYYVREKTSLREAFESADELYNRLEKLNMASK